MRRRTILLLLGIVLLGFLIRVYKIDALPMYGDELTMVYDTYSISETGMDATGQKFPLTFRMGAGRPGGYIYFSVPFVALLGPTIWGVRALSLLSGLGIIILMYFLGKKLFNEKDGFVAAFLTAISPWDIYLSRGGFEAHFGLFLALAGIVAFIHKKYILWAIPWGIAIFTYPTFKLTLPLMFVLLAVLEGIPKLFRNKHFWAAFLILFIFGAGAAAQTFMAGSERRFLSENIFADRMLERDTIAIASQERVTSTLPEFLKPVFINRPISYARVLLDNYMSNISPNFLILRGDGNPRTNPGEMGMIYFVELPLIIISLFLIWGKTKRTFWLLFIWVLITPLATMFFPEAHGLRNGLMLPPLLLLSAYALSHASKKQFVILSALIAIQLIYILVRIYAIAPAKFTSFWSAEAKEAALLAIRSNEQGEKVTLHITEIDNIEYAYEVYAKLPPEDVIAQFGKNPKVYENVTITD